MKNKSRVTKVLVDQWASGYIGSRIRLLTQNSSVGVIFDAQQNDQNNFSKFRKFPIISESSLSSAILEISSDFQTKSRML